MGLTIEVQTGEIFTSDKNVQALILAIAGHQLFPVTSKDGEDLIVNTASIVWVKET